MGIVTRSCAVQLSTRCMYKPERRPLGPILATPPIKPNKPHFADPTGGYPPESALGPPQPYNSILDERRACQPVRLRAALVTGLGVRCVGRLREPIYVVGRPFGSNPIRSATCTSQTRDEVPDGAFFLFVSKWFSEAIRLSETGVSAEISL